MTDQPKWTEILGIDPDFPDPEAEEQRLVEEKIKQAWKDGWATREEYTGPYISPELAYRQRGAYEELRRMGRDG